jgi:omega-hydroxy-beta-dihydromenaquinone-9 sulfotransferase
MSKPRKDTKPVADHYHWWWLRSWHGMRMGAWVRLLARNRFQVHPLRIPMAAIITLCSGLNSLLGGVDRLIYGRRVDRTQIERPPLFILGHWRCGTTFLHELLSEDDRFASPTGYECIAVNHVLLTQRWLPVLLQPVVPSRRPMDAVALGAARPQEDEFALVNMGIPSPYLRTAFPNRPPQFMEYLDFVGVPEKDLQRWKNAMLHFARLVTFNRQRQLVFKSPPHTGRIKVLLEIFPGAKFVHLVRDPYTMFASTLHLWQAMERVEGFQLSKGAGLREYVFQSLERMYRAFENQRHLIAPGHICDVHYEDLVSDPIGQVQTVYEKLALGDFEQVRPHLEGYVTSHKDFMTNRHQLDEPTRSEIARRWATYFENYGYPAKQGGLEPATKVDCYTKEAESPVGRCLQGEQYAIVMK